MKNLFSLLAIIIVCSCMSSCNKSSNNTQNKDDSTVENNLESISKNTPLNLSIFVDLSDRIMKAQSNMMQEEKDKIILKELANKFIDKNTTKFTSSKDIFQIVFYPAPNGAQDFSKNLSLYLNQLKPQEKKEALLNFQENLSNGVDSLYSNAVKANAFFGSDIWGYFSKDKVKDLYNDGFRNVLVVITDGYIYDANNKVKDGNNYSYILPSTLSIPNSGLIPCKISNPNLEIYVIECNANPQTDFPKMKTILEKWFKDMGIEKMDIQDSDIPANVIKHLDKEIFSVY